MNRYFKYTLLTLSILFFKSHHVLQNLVPNGDFEYFDSIPKHPDELNSCKYWISPINSSDYFSVKSNHNSASFLPSSYAGHTFPKSGDFCAGISSFFVDYGYREYLQIKLTDELQREKTYELKFYIKKSNKSYYHHHNLISFSLTDSNIISRYIKDSSDFKIKSDKKGREGLEGKHITINFEDMSSSDGWIEIESIYKAKGGEKYLTIGLFYDDYSFWKFWLTKYFFKKKKNNILFFSNYYFIDKVSLVASED